MTNQIRLNAALITSLLTELAETVQETEQVTIVLVGGAPLSLLGLRDSTLDIDSITPLNRALKTSIAEIAKVRGLPHNWLNDSARAYAPENSRRHDEFVFLETPRLKVIGLSLADIFLMKLARASARDISDMRILWPHVAANFVTSTNVVRDFYRLFPTEPMDEFLEDFVDAVIAGAV